MANYHHKPIKKFNLDGIIHDEAFIARLKTEYIRLVVSEMRLSGYVPRLDIDPDFTIQYNSEKEYFEFILSIHGIYTGRKKSEWITGIDGTTPIYTQQNKLNEFSQEQASQ
jgi:hypothetical protein